MSKLKIIIKAASHVMRQLSPATVLLESTFCYDFKIGNQQQNSMQICFSYLSVWLFLLVALLLPFDPTKNSWSLIHLLSEENNFVLALLDGRLPMLFLAFGIFFVVEWLIRSELIISLVILYFLSRAEVHVSLALMALWGVFLARICYQWWALFDLKGSVRHVWNRVNLIQLVSFFISILISLWCLNFLLINHFFDASSGLTRLNFVISMLCLFFGLNQLLLSIWGHFYFNKTQDPSVIEISYSTCRWILRFSISNYLISELKKVIEVQLPKRKAQIAELLELTMHQTEMLRRPLQSELEHLTEASQRISQI